MLALMGVSFGLLMSQYRSMFTHLAPVHLRAGLVGIVEAGDRFRTTVSPKAMGAVIDVFKTAVGLDAALGFSCLLVMMVPSGGGFLFLLVAGSYRTAQSIRSISTRSDGASRR